VEAVVAKTDARVDQYIAKAADFAKPILRHIREVVHAACPDVEETMKWSFPHFDYHGEMMCGMAAFKAHCSFGFWKARLVLDGPGGADAMGQFGKITSLEDLPSDRELTRYVKKAARLNEDGIKVARKPAAPKKPLAVPPEFAAALKKAATARKAFDAFSPSHRREYLEWIIEAKSDATRQKRIATAIEWLAQGKSRNWKYERK
jgi:uncharacterized protein YdeI (YjbR/CyaY-like superfamily)